MNALEYYRNQEPKEMPIWMVTIAMPFLLLYFLIAMPVGLLIVSIQILFPAKSSRIAKYWSDKGVKFIIGYDSGSKYADKIIGELSARKDIRFFDWHNFKGRKLKDLYKELPDQENLLRTFLYADNCDYVVVPPFDGFNAEENPTQIYVVGVDKKNNYFFMATAYPFLDDWNNPEKVLTQEEFEKDLFAQINSERVYS